MPEGPVHRLVFMGTGPFAMPALYRLRDGANLVGVVTQPDRAAGRGQTVQRGEVATAATSFGLPLLQPATFKSPEAVEELGKLQPDVLVVASYGLILPKSVLALPRFGSLNLHPSMLPRYRGPSPIASAILAGDTSTGVSIIEMTARMDAGPIVAQKPHEILPHDTTETLTLRLAEANADLLMAAMPDWLARSSDPHPQDEAAATYTAMLTKHMGRINWSRTAAELERQVRAFIPWPVCQTTIQTPIRVWEAEPAQGDPGRLPGDIIRCDNGGITVQAGEGALRIVELQPAGGKRMSAADFARGRKNLVGVRAE